MEGRQKFWILTNIKMNTLPRFSGQPEGTAAVLPIWWIRHDSAIHLLRRCSGGYLR